MPPRSGPVFQVSFGCTICDASCRHAVWHYQEAQKQFKLKGVHDTFAGHRRDYNAEDYMYRRSKGLRLDIKTNLYTGSIPLVFDASHARH
eukprot:1182744-Rhodomonas_salina.1